MTTPSLNRISNKLSGSTRGDDACSLASHSPGRLIGSHYLANHFRTSGSFEQAGRFVVNRHQVSPFAGWEELKEDSMAALAAW